MEMELATSEWTGLREPEKGGKFNFVFQMEDRQNKQCAPRSNSVLRAMQGKRLAKWACQFPVC